MPVDLSEWLFETKPSTQPTYMDKNITSEYDPKGTRVLLAALLDTKFSDYLFAGNEPMLPSVPTNPNAVADTGGLAPGIRAGNVGKSTVSYSDNKNYKMENPEELFADLTVLLHEITHTRQSQSRDQSQTKAIGKDWQDLLVDAKALGFPSVGSGVAGGDNLNEFLATAVPLKDMQRRGIVPEQLGSYKKVAESLPKLEKKYPWLETYIKVNAQPEVPSVKGWEAYQQPMMAIKELVRNLFNKK